MSSESFPKEFEKTTEVLPFTKYGLTSIQEFKEAEQDIQLLEWLKKAGLTPEEINLLKVNEAGIPDHRIKIETNARREKLDAIYRKINNLISESESSEDEDIPPSTSSNTYEPPTFNKMERNLLTFYPKEHPMNNINEIAQNLFTHLMNDEIMPITKRRKILRRLERKKDRILARENQIDIGIIPSTSKVERPESLWDLKEMPRKQPKKKSVRAFIGPKKPTMYTVKDNKIVRLEPVHINNRNEQFNAVDIVAPINNAEVQLLEGTKMSLDNIKKIERFKDYEPGFPSKTLYLKNIAPSVSQEQLSLLFAQFTLANGGPVDVRLMSGRMRGQAFVIFHSIELAIQALEEINGTILSGQPVITQFSRNTNRIDDNR